MVEATTNIINEQSLNKLIGGLVGAVEDVLEKASAVDILVELSAASSTASSQKGKKRSPARKRGSASTDSGRTSPNFGRGVRGSAKKPASTTGMHAESNARRVIPFGPGSELPKSITPGLFATLNMHKLISMPPVKESSLNEKTTISVRPQKRQRRASCSEEMQALATAAAGHQTAPMVGMSV